MAQLRSKIDRLLAKIPDLGRTSIPPFDVVVEILSPDDAFQKVIRKCKLYAEWGISTIAVVDPEGREAWVWDKDARSLNLTTAIGLPNGKSISLAGTFAEPDATIQ